MTMNFSKLSDNDSDYRDAEFINLNFCKIIVLICLISIFGEYLF